MFRYETHMHTWPVSRCGKAEVKETLEFYKNLGYDGVFVTNHFIDGCINIDPSKSYEEKINFYFSDYEKATAIGEELGIKVFCAEEMSYKGTDFLVYGIDKNWYLEHPEFEKMKKSEQLPLLMENGALVIHAHPFREAAYIDHIRLFPRCVHGVEIINANRTEFENMMAETYAEAYGLLKTAGSDNHKGPAAENLAGLEFEEPINSVGEFIVAVKEGKGKIFKIKR